ncbi:acyl-CoA transferase [Paracoccus stylophorae]|uniref:Acyl-CoA transferase n=2 Tax=Paracoccus TaxID=265 RepID=A0ABY7SYH9_9RHOB|nr:MULTISPECIES: acyl-CoA transferase [Paracoccus]MBU3029708.1 acyl-CoA transferase [Paracoccus marinaquae]WCR11002.1 acyl-CoA transferase [Paracoccus stylophorae]
MTTKREEVLSALFTLLQGIGGGTIVQRNEALPERIPAAGLLILRDGTPGEAEVTLSPLRYHWQHRAEVEVFVRGSSGLELAFDALAERIGHAIAADRTLGGLCDWIETDAPEPADLAVEGAPTIRAAVLILTLHYTSNDPLG